LTHHPRKRFSQNFLQDPEILDRIVNAIAPRPGEHIVEIGPGLGALTTLLLPLVGEMDAIELDRDLIAPLTQVCKNIGKLCLHSADALQFNFNELCSDASSLRIVGNLPYQISTPLIFHLISQINVVRDMHFMLQKEVVDRLAASVGTKAYGRLSVMVQYHFTVEPLFIVPPEAFYPAPKVISSVVRMQPKTTGPITENYELFSEIVKQAFNYRRKTLTNSLKGLVSTENLLSLGIDPSSRAEQLTVSQFIAMSRSSRQKAP